MTARTVLSTRANITSMSDSPDTRISPIGRTVAEDIAQRRAEDPEYRRLDNYYRPMMDLATAVILRRGALEMTQEELARRMGTTASSISRIESGQHRTRPDTLKRLAEALGGTAVMGFEFPAADNAEATSVLVTL
jgi:ribosome-binding protein aMBF1 (putative translation factor)